jgi:hypothetical protein
MQRLENRGAKALLLPPTECLEREERLKTLTVSAQRGAIYKTIFGTNPQPDMSQIKRLAGHELGSGIVYMPNRSDVLGSWYNWGPPFEHSKPSTTDTLMLRYIFSRETGVDTPDIDWERRQ